MICESRTMVVPAAAGIRRSRRSCRCQMLDIRQVACLLAAGTCLIQMALLVRPTLADQHQQSNHNQNAHRTPLEAKISSSNQLEHAANQQQQQPEHQHHLTSISAPTASNSQAANSNDISQLMNAVSGMQLANLNDFSVGPASLARSRSPRSIGEMFKKIFNGNKRSKNSGAQGSRDWDQQQQAAASQQQQFQQQQNQAANMASMMAAAASQHAVYASPFATYSPQSSASALYPQFSPYSSAGLVAWPATSALAHSLRATPTLIGPASPVALASSAGPLYAAASQSYNSYTAPPSPGAVAGQPQAAASHQHASAVPAPPGLAGGHPGNSGPSSIDFHQVLDAFVRTSGFGPAGDQEAAAASGYGAKTDGTPVFSFKKLVSLPFYLSTEEKSLDGLANAMGPAGSAGGYSLHSMPIMRRHVRRMSTPSQPPAITGSQQQFNNQLAALQAATDSSQQMQRSERAQQQSYSQYLNAINNQIASLTANNQLLQYLSARQPQQSGDVTETALANYQALLSAANAGATYQKSAQPVHTAQIGQQSAARQVAPTSGQMIAAASMVQPSTIQAPQSVIQQHQKQQLEQDRDFANLLNSVQQQFSSGSVDPFVSAFANQIHSFSHDGHRLGQAGAQQQQTYYPQMQQNYWPGNSQFATDSSSFLTVPNGNNNGQDATFAAPISQQQHQMQQINSAHQQQVQSVGSQNNALGNHHHHHHQLEQQNQQATSGSSATASTPQSATGQVDGAVGSTGTGQQSQVALGAGQQSAAAPSGNNNQQIEGQQQQQQQK